MLKSILCDYSDAYIVVNGTITITGAGDDSAARQANERNKQVILKSCVFSLKIQFLRFLANFVFVVSHLKIHPAVHLNISKVLTSL